MENKYHNDNRANVTVEIKVLDKLSPSILVICTVLLNGIVLHVSHW
jgi:hypothetical protein